MQITHVLFFFLRQGLVSSSTWPRVYCDPCFPGAAVLLPQLPESWDYRYELPCMSATAITKKACRIVSSWASVHETYVGSIPHS